MANTTNTSSKSWMSRLNLAAIARARSTGPLSSKPAVESAAQSTDNTAAPKASIYNLLNLLVVKAIVSAPASSPNAPTKQAHAHARASTWTSTPAAAASAPTASSTTPSKPTIVNYLGNSLTSLFTASPNNKTTPFAAAALGAAASTSTGKGIRDAHNPILAAAGSALQTHMARVKAQASLASHPLSDITAEETCEPDFDTYSVKPTSFALPDIIEDYFEVKPLSFPLKDITEDYFEVKPLSFPLKDIIAKSSKVKPTSFPLSDITTEHYDNNRIKSFPLPDVTADHFDIKSWPLKDITTDLDYTDNKGPASFPLNITEDHYEIKSYPLKDITAECIDSEGLSAECIDSKADSQGPLTSFALLDLMESYWEVKPLC